MFTVFVGTALLAASPDVKPGALCKAAVAAAPQMHCVETELGVALANDEARAEDLALYGQAGEARFKTYFGREVPRYALIDFDAKSKIGDVQRALNTAGFKRTLPWLSRAAYAEALRSATRQMVDAMTSNADMTAEMKASLLDEEMAKAERGLSRHEMDLFEATVVPHEIGHGWFTETYWPGFVMDKLGHYGSPSPDWLDETAAILMESGDSAELRRYHFREALLGRDKSVDPEELLNLGQFLLREHPEKSTQEEIADDSAERKGVTISLVPTEGGGGARSGARYYEQARVFADFLIDRTGDRAIFGSIGEAFGEGRSMNQWLSANGPANNLADTVTGLERQWRDWLQARFGQRRQ